MTGTESDRRVGSSATVIAPRRRRGPATRALGPLLGVISGSLVAIYPALEVAIAPYILALQTMPKVAIAPLLMVWFGFGLESKIVVAAIVAWVPVMINVLVGLRAVEAERIELLRSMAATRWQILWRLRIPNSLPYLFSGLESAVLLSLLG